jgi:hypothetical protein
LRAIVGDHNDIAIIQIRGIHRHLHQARRRGGIRRVFDTQADWQHNYFVVYCCGQRRARGRER